MPREIPPGIHADDLITLLASLCESLVGNVEIPLEAIGVGVPAALIQGAGVMPACVNQPGTGTVPCTSR